MPSFPARTICIDHCSVWIHAEQQGKSECSQCSREVGKVKRKKGHRRAYSYEFKRNAVLQHMTLGKSIRQVARELGIQHAVVGRWVNKVLTPGNNLDSRRPKKRGRQLESGSRRKLAQYWPFLERSARDDPLLSDADAARRLEAKHPAARGQFPNWKSFVAAVSKEYRYMQC